MPETASPTGTKSCPFCAETINAEAKKCKHCQSMLDDKPVVIEQTSKRIKRKMLNGVGLFIGGIMVAVMFEASENQWAATTGALLMIVGVIVFIHAKWKKWWHHG